MARYEDLTVGNLEVEGQLIGGGVAANLAKAGGNEWYVDYTNGSNGNSGKRPDNALKTLEAAYESAVANQHDIIYLMAGSSGLQLDTGTTTFTWSKSYTHLVGISNGAPFANRARIFHSNLDAASIFTISASGCLFDNFYFSHGNGTATNVTMATISGSRNVFRNVHWAGPQNATEGAANAYAGLVITGSENAFLGGTIGSNTTPLAGTAGTLLSFTGSAARNIFHDVNFQMYATAAGAQFMDIAANGMDRYVWFKNCLFHNQINIGSATAITQAFDVPASINGCVIAENCLFIGCTDVADATGDGNVYFMPHTATANAHGLAVAYAAS